MGQYATNHSAFFRTIHRKTRYLVSTVVFGGDYTIRKHALCLFICFGLAGSLIDLDHLIVAQTQMARPLHLPYLIAVWIVFIGYYTYIHRRIHKSCVN